MATMLGSAMHLTGVLGGAHLKALSALDTFSTVEHPQSCASFPHPSRIASLRR